MFSLSVHPRRFILGLFAVEALLLVLHLGTQTFSLITGHDVVFGMIPLFNLNAEANLPSFFSTVLLASASTLLAVNAVIYRRGDDGWYVKYWLFLSIIFALLAVDELSSLHEQLTVPVRNALDTKGALYFAWVIPYAGFVLGVGLIMLKFLWRMERRIALGFIFSGVLYIMGAAGMEMLGGQAAEASGQRSVSFMLFSTIEELMEMSGVIIFIHFILSDIFKRVGHIRVELVRPE